MHLDVDEAGFGEHSASELLTEDGADPCAAVRERHGHAVQRADRVEKRRHRVLEVVFERVGTVGLLHEEHAPGSEGPLDVRQHGSRVDLVVDRVEHEHEVVAILDVEPSGIADLECDVREPRPGRLGPCAADRAIVEVVADERRLRERAPEHDQRVAGAAGDVRDPNARLEPLGQARHQWQIQVDEPAVEEDPADAIHDVGELGAVLGVRNAASLSEGAGDLVHVLAQVGAQRGHRGEVHSPVGEHSGVCGREGIGLRQRVIREDARGHHCPEPFPHVTLGEAGTAGEVLARGRPVSGGGEEPGAMTDVDHVVEHRARVDRHELSRELLDVVRIECRCVGHAAIVDPRERAHIRRTTSPKRRRERPPLRAGPDCGRAAS